MLSQLARMWQRKPPVLGFASCVFMHISASCLRSSHNQTGWRLSSDNLVTCRLMRAGLGAQGSSESLTELMEQLAVHFPTLTRPLIGERDEYMAFRLRMLASKCAPTAAQAHGPYGRALLAVRGGACAWGCTCLCGLHTCARQQGVCACVLLSASIMPRVVARALMQVWCSQL